MKNSLLGLGEFWGVDAEVEIALEDGILSSPVRLLGPKESWSLTDELTLLPSQNFLLLFLANGREINWIRSASS